MYQYHHQQQRHYEANAYHNSHNHSIFRHQDQRMRLAPFRHYYTRQNLPETSTTPRSKPFYDSTNTRSIEPGGSNYFEESNLYMPNLSTRPTFDDTDKSQLLPQRTPVVNPPSWCAPAKGECRLEPIGMTREAHQSVDLTTKNYYRIGRSPKSSIPLYHTTASRNHAVLYHHPKSNVCYIIDNYSVHGTYIDGVKVQAGKETRVRRGAIIRFGSFGCPTFILKSFTVSVFDLMMNLGCVMDTLLFKEEEESMEPSSDDKLDDGKISNNVQEYFRHAQHWVQQPSSRRSNAILQQSKDDETSESSDSILTCIRGDGGGVACISNEKEIPYASLTLIHTRLNAIGCSNIHDVLYRQNEALQGEYCKVSGKVRSIMINGYEKFASLSRHYSSSVENSYSKPITSSLTGKKRKRSNLKTPSPPPSTATFSPKPKCKSILHSISMDEDCFTPNIVTNHEQQYQPSYSNGYFYNTVLPPRRRTIRFEDEIMNDSNQFQDDNLYSYPQVSFELCDNR